MLTNKKRCQKGYYLLLVTAVVAWLAGCTPAGPRALLRGKRLIDQGKYADAVDDLKRATSLLPTNAIAWDYLGLAYHHAGQSANAIDAYQRALKLNHNLVVVHYNLGCLLLEENRADTLDEARNQLTAFVLNQGKSIDGWLKLGTVQLRLSELPQAEASFKEVLRLGAENVEALNDLGVIQLQRRRYRDAFSYFSTALKLQPTYGPALLNLAVTEMYLNNPTQALREYQAYLALSPRPANWDAVNATAQQLEQQLNPPPPPVRPVTNAMVAANPVTNPPTRPIATPTNVSRPETVASVPPRQVSQPRPQPVSPEPSVRPEAVRLPDNQPVRYANNTTTSASVPPTTYSRPTSPSASSSEAMADTEVVTDQNDVSDASGESKHGLLQKLNPMGLFHKKPKNASKTSQPVDEPEPHDDSIGQGLVYQDPSAVSKSSSSGPAKPISITRYPYLSPVKPPVGNRAEAERLLANGGQAQRERRIADAVAFYRAAAQKDPSYFEAQMSLGLATFNLGELPESLRAYEMALAINPESFIARFNFGLALRRANYTYDAVQQLEKLLASNPASESPAHLAMVHLTLANLYAEQFHQTGPARAHYLKVLELDPHNAQATSIRYWLQENG